MVDMQEDCGGWLSYGIRQVGSGTLKNPPSVLQTSQPPEFSDSHDCRNSRWSSRRVKNEVQDVQRQPSLDVWNDTLRPMIFRSFCYPWGIMSALNGDKARFNRERKAKLARRERSQAVRRKLKNHAPPRAAGTQL